MNRDMIHIRDFGIQRLRGNFFGSTGRRLDPQPRAWRLVSDAHIDVLTDVMSGVHAGLPANLNLVVGATPPPPLSSWETMHPTPRCAEPSRHTLFLPLHF